MPLAKAFYCFQKAEGCLGSRLLEGCSALLYSVGWLFHIILCNIATSEETLTLFNAWISNYSYFLFLLLEGKLNYFDVKLRNILLAVSSGTPGIMWDRLREDVLSGHKYPPQGIKLANLHIIDRKVCNRVQELIHSETKTHTASCSTGGS